MKVDEAPPAGVGAPTPISGLEQLLRHARVTRVELQAEALKVG